MSLTESYICLILASIVSLSVSVVECFDRIQNCVKICGIRVRGVDCFVRKVSCRYLKQSAILVSMVD